jgi:hypothetical protein
MIDRVVEEVREGDAWNRTTVFFEPKAAFIDSFYDAKKEPRRRMTDAEWAKIVRYSLLPDVCREELDFIIEDVRKFSAAEKPSELKRRKNLMEDAAAQAKMLAGIIRRLKDMNVEGIHEEAEDRLILELNAYSRHLKKRIENRRPGRKNDSKVNIIERVDRLLHDYIGRQVRTGNADDDGFAPLPMLDQVFRLGDSPLEAGLLKTLVSGYVKSKVRRGGKWSWDVWSDKGHPWWING